MWCSTSIPRSRCTTSSPASPNGRGHPACTRGFSVLLAGSGLVEYSRLTPEVRDQLHQIIEAVKPRFDVLLIDTGAGISDVVLYAVSLAHEVIVVATPEPTSMTDAYATIKVLSSQQSRDQLNLVVNQVGRTGDGRAICNQLQQVVERFVQSPAGQSPKLNFLGDVPLDSSVREAVQNASCCWVASRQPGVTRHCSRWPPVCCLASPLDSAPCCPFHVSIRIRLRVAGRRCQGARPGRSLLRPDGPGAAVPGLACGPRA